LQKVITVQISAHPHIRLHTAVTQPPARVVRACHGLACTRSVRFRVF
jgi:hypothetical protein